MRLLITGAGGYLGVRLAERAARNGVKVLAGYTRHPERVDRTKSLFLDFTAPTRLIDSLDAQELDANDAILHTAAVNPGGDEDLMDTVNLEGSRIVARAAALAGARLVHVSTDVVHDGTRAPYADGAPPSPLNAYGLFKAAAEEAVLTEAPDAAVVRTSLIYGLRIMDRGTEGFTRRLQQGEPVRLFHDVMRMPIWVDSLAEALLRLVDLDVSGRINIAGSQALSREQFGRKMLDFWQVPGRERVESVAAAEISDRIPLDLRLDLARAKSLGFDLPGVDEVLRRYRSATGS